MTAPGTMRERLQLIITDHTAMEIEGTMIDVQSANAILTVYNALSETNRVKFVNRSICEMGHIAWTLLDRAQVK